MGVEALVSLLQDLVGGVREDQHVRSAVHQRRPKQVGLCARKSTITLQNSREHIS